MTTPGGTPGLPSGTVLTLENLESRVQDMTPAAMKGRAAEWFPAMANNTTGGNPLAALSPFGFLTDIWSRLNSTIANADPAAVNSVDDLGPLFVEFVENLPVIGQFVQLAEAFLGQYDGEDPTLLAIQSLFGIIPRLIGGLLSGSLIPPLDASKIISGQFLTNLIPGLDVSKIISGIFSGSFIPGLDASKITSGQFAQSLISGLPAALSGIANNVSSVIDSIVEQWGGGSGGGGPAVPSVAAVGTVLGNANRGTVSVPPPSGTAKDEVVFVFIDNTSAVPTGLTPPADFTIAPNTGYQTADQSTQLRVYWKRCTGTDSVPYDFVFDTPNYCKAVAIRCTNIITTGNPIDTDVFAGGNAASFTGLALTTTADNALLLWAANSWGTQTITPPAGFTSNVAYASGGGLAVGSVTEGVHGPTGTMTGTISGYSGWCQWMGALKPTTAPVHHSITDLVGVLNAIPGVKLVGSVASSLLSGILGGGLIPSLDASKIISGKFLANLIPNLSASIINAGTFLSSLIPSLDASKIVSGSLLASVIPALDAAKIATGTLLGSLIPALDASKITTGTFPQSMLTITSLASSIITGTLGAAQIPTLDASKIVSGTLSTVVSGVGSFVDALFSGLGGSGSGITNTQLQNQAANVTQTANSALAAAVAAQTAQQGSDQGSVPPGGTNVTFTFSGSDGAALPSDFVTLPAGGLVIRGSSGYVGIPDGAANGQYGARTNTVQYATDDQSLAVVLGDQGATIASTNLHIRCDSGQTRGAYAKVYSNSVSIGYFTGGVRGTYTQWVSASVNVSGGARVAFRCVGLNYYLIVNGQQVLSYTNSAANVLTGAAYRYPMISEGQAQSFWTYYSFRIAAMIVSDYQVSGGATTTSWKISRSLRTAVTQAISGGNAANMPNGFFTTSDYATGVTVQTLETGQIKIQTAGWYRLSCGLVALTTSGVGQSNVPVFWAVNVNGAQQTGPIAAGTDTIYYLNVNDVVQPMAVAVGDVQSSTSSQTQANGAAGLTFGIASLKGFASFAGKYEEAA